MRRGICACLQKDLPLEVTKRNPASLILKLTGIPSMEDFRRPDFTAASKRLSTSDAGVLDFAVNLSSATTGLGLMKAKI